MFNRTYQTRASRGGMVSAGEVLAELVERAADRQAFYRPPRRPWPGARAHDSKKSRSAKLHGIQLELFGNDVAPASNNRVVTPPPADETPDQMFDRLFPADN